MKVLIVTPSENEIKNRDKKSLFFIKSLIDNIRAKSSDIEIQQMDITDVDILKLSVSGAWERIKNSGVELEEIDIVHTFSMFPIVFKAFFNQLIISSFELGDVDERLKPFIPYKSCPGYARYDVVAIDTVVVEELYKEVFNNRRRCDNRPWGWWRSLELDKNFKIKHIYVAPGEKLSLQTHRFRSEIWIVASGSGLVTIDEEVLKAEKGKVFSIEKGQIHRAEGGENGIHIVEVQTGDYLGEDDIIRLEDIYGRK